MKALVVYFSRTGSTAKLAQDVATRLGCDIDPIVDTVKWSGIIGWFKAGRGAMKKTLTKLEPPKLDPARYDLVIVGTPIWASNVCVPTRTYLHDNKGKLKRVAFLITGGGDKFAPVFAEMEAICGQRPAATLGVMTKDVKRGDHAEKVGRFVAELGS